MIFGKVINGELHIAPNILNKDGKQYINPPEELYLELGYLPVEYAEMPNEKEGYHLVQNWFEDRNQLVQNWTYVENQDEIVRLTQKVKDLQNQLNQKAPTMYYNGLEVDEGQYYTDGIHTIRAIASGTPSNFNDPNYFD